MSEQMKTWWTEGNRKLIMVVVAIIALAAIVITWMVVQPEGVTLSDLLTWAGGLITTLTGMGVGGNVLEHRAKQHTERATMIALHEGIKDMAEKEMEHRAKAKGSGIGAALIVVCCLILSGCASGGDVTVGDLIPSAQISREGGCLKVVVDQPVPAPEGWEATTRVTVRQAPEEGCGEPEPR